MEGQKGDSRRECVERMREAADRNQGAMGAVRGFRDDYLEQEPSQGAFKARMLLAVLLFCGYVFLDRTGEKIFEKNSQDIEKMIVETIQLENITSALQEI